MANEFLGNWSNSDAGALASVQSPEVQSIIYNMNESAVFMDGRVIPTYGTNNSVKIPKFGAGPTAEVIDGSSNSQVTVSVLSDSSTTIEPEIVTASYVLTDKGNLNPDAIGRPLGQSLASYWNGKVRDVFDTAQAVTGASAKAVDTTSPSLTDLINAVKMLRERGYEGQLYALYSYAGIADLHKNLISNNNNAVMVQEAIASTGYYSTIYGVRVFQSTAACPNTKADGSTANPSQGVLFAPECAAIAVQRGPQLRVQRDEQYVGNVLVASYIAAIGVVDSDRYVRMYDHT